MSRRRKTAGKAGKALPGRFERLIAGLLRTGVWTSLALMLGGLALTFVHHPGYLDPGLDLHRLTAPGAAFPHAWPAIMEGLRAGRGQAVAALGLLILIGTPILRVAVSSVGFLRQGDRLYALITATVLALLVASFLLGKAG
jgi:uncharacterized membrane protein